MQKFTFDRRKTGFFTEQQNLFAYDQERLLPFISRTFSIMNVEKQIETKSAEFSEEKRDLLVQELRKQYANLPEYKEVNINLDLLQKENTFTITTGHQLSLFTGPVFFIYKILHVIRLCEELTKTYPNQHFVPIFWMASEDHDLQEVQSVDVFGKTLCWETDQQGAVGRMNTEGMEVLKSTLRSFFQGKEGVDVDPILDAYNGSSQAEALKGLVHELFGAYGLICLDGDDEALKRSFLPVIQKELREQFSHEKVEGTNRSIEREGFKVQVKTREVNLFYLNNIERERVLLETDGFFLKGEGVLTTESTLKLTEVHPDRFSPNVVLRPLYQEYILPNLCYVGGVGELSYWLQLKGVFDAVGIAYPLIQARTSMIYMDSTITKKLEKAALQLEDLFSDRQVLKQQKLKEQAGDDLDFSSIESRFKEFSEDLSDKIVSVEPGLIKYAESELVKINKQLDSIKDKLVRSLKQKYDVQLNTIDQVFDKLFPDGMLQERVLNIFGMCPDGKIHDRIRQLHGLIDPLDPDLVIVMD
jgi:bacillithiol biosynthesis cysteine-adding enzyme BshC